MKFHLTLTLAALSTASAFAQANPSAAYTDMARRANYCSDPWVTIAIWDLTANTRNPNGFGQFGECNVQLYNGGRWNSYAQLRSAIDASLRALSSAGVQTSLIDNRNGTLSITMQAGSAFDRVVIQGRVVAQGGGNVVAQGGGNVVAQGGGNVIAQGAGNIVSHDGGTLISEQGPSLRTLQSATKRIIPLPGNTALVLGR